MLRKLPSAILLAVLVLFSVISCSNVLRPTDTVSASTSCPASKTITLVYSPIPNNFNFLDASSTSTFFIGALEYLTLAPFPLEANGSLDWADSATNWITSNSNFTQWTFHIRPGLTWSNGTAVNASDIVSWMSPSYALNPQYDFTSSYLEVTSVRAINSDTAVVNLNASDAQFPNRMSIYYYAPMVSPSDVAAGPAANLFGTGVADGPWYISNYTSGSTTLTMLPNPYWPGPKPYACALDVIFVEDLSQMSPFLISGQADWAGVVNVGNIAGFSSNPNIHLAVVPADQDNSLWYNLTSYPYNMTQFRQALAYSINSSAIVQQSLFGYGGATNNAQGEVPTEFNAYNPSQPKYPYNLSDAMSLLHSIGFTGGGSPNSPLKFPNGTAMSTTIFTDTGIPSDISIAQQTAGFLEQLGISVTVDTLTVQNQASDYASNALNIRNNLVIETSGGPFYLDPWLDGQPGCAVSFYSCALTWWSTPSPFSPSGNPQWLYPASADQEYQSNLTALDDTAALNLTGQEHYVDNIQNLNAEYLPKIELVYPDHIFAYNTAKWGNWPGSFPSMPVWNVTLFDSLLPATGSATTSASVTSQNLTTPSSTTITTLTEMNTGTIELIAAVVVIVIVIGGIATYVLRRKPAS